MKSRTLSADHHSRHCPRLDRLLLVLSDFIKIANLAFCTDAKCSSSAAPQVKRSAAALSIKVESTQRHESFNHVMSVAAATSMRLSDFDARGSRFD